MAGSLDGWTPERWAEARAILNGERGDRVSMKAAARAVGVSLRDFRMWETRSREQRPEDPPVIWEIAEVIDAAREEQAGRLEDELWQRAVGGVEEPLTYQGRLTGEYVVKKDTKALMRLLEVRDPRYSKTIEHTLKQDDVAEIFRRLQAGGRLAAAKAEAIDAEWSDIPRPALPVAQE